MLMHNGLLADPTHPSVRRMKEITSKGAKKITDTEYAERDKLEWCASLYWDEDDGPIIPSDNIERCVQLGAQKTRIGKDVQAAVFCVEPHAVLEYDGPRNKEKLYADQRFAMRKGVCVNQSRVIRLRPMFPTGWQILFTLEFDDTIINQDKIEKAMRDAGALIGLGDWRPKFGRFLVEMI